MLLCVCEPTQSCSMQSKLMDFLFGRSALLLLWLLAVSSVSADKPPLTKLPDEKENQNTVRQVYRYIDEMMVPGCITKNTVVGHVG